MKKLSLLLICSLMLLSCDLEDDGPNTMFTYAEVTDLDVPEFFEAGEVYDIDVFYVLPTACHSVAGLEAKRGGATGEDRRKIYVSGVASYDANLTDCDIEDGDLEREGSFRLTIGAGEDEPYTFYLWTGINDDDENEYTEIIVPVGEPEETGETPVDENE